MTVIIKYLYNTTVLHVEKLDMTKNIATAVCSLKEGGWENKQTAKG